MKQFFAIISLLLVCITNGNAQTEDNPVVWETSVEKISETTYDLIFMAKILDQWHLYSQYNPEDASLHRYDFLTLAAIAIQVAMLAFKLETLGEAKVILIFHMVGTVMELFKTAAGSWIYPEDSFLHIGAVPLFSGFMYASVGSYIARVWRIFDFSFSNYPNPALTWLLALAT